MDTTNTALSRLEARESSDGRHELEGVCVPYGVVTRKAGATPERFKFGAFGEGLGALVGKLRLLDHNHSETRRPVAVATALEERTGGLWGRFRFYNTPEGRAAFENVAEDTYGGLSVGFIPVAAPILDDGTREVRQARLHHVSLVDEPAYDTAEILAVRGAVDLSRFEFMRTRPKLTLDVGDERLLTALVRRRLDSTSAR